ncbi:UNVERIFIED_CONTAM: putative phosphohydrolases [Acetivibrio alkalicellulosi]
MYIIQVSDLHNSEDTKKEEDRCLKITKSLIMTVKKEVPTNQQILVVVCGDLINKGDKNAFNFVKKVLDEIRSQFASSYNVKFGFVPGNHDLIDGDLTEFKGFINNYNKESDNFKSSSCYSISIEEDDLTTDIIFINSLYKGAKDKGEINYDELIRLLEQLDSSTKKIFVLHHTIMSMDENDRSSIINAARFVKVIEKYRVSMLLHGHTHGLDAISIGCCNCAIIGVGALFSRNYPDVNSQFNLIEYQNGVVKEVTNFTHHHDRHQEHEIMKDTKLNIYSNRDKNVFSGEKISDIYKDLIASLNMSKRLYNVRMCGRFNYAEFKKDVEHFFSKDKDFEFDYGTLASKWQSSKCPEELYFTHGENYYNSESNKEGISYIIDTLKKKSTSSRAVLSTISMKDIDGKEDYFLPSLMVIQFGFEKEDTLIITMYLRALEARRFLKINICEILHLAEQVRKDKRFDNIEVNINAFRVQIENGFSCFIKSELDKLATHEISKRDIQEIVRNKDINKIINLLEGKNRHIETVVVSKGIEELINSIEWVNRYENLEHYDVSILDSMKKISEALKEIKDKRETTSIYDELEELKNNVRKQIKKTIDLLKSFVKES